MSNVTKATLKNGLKVVNFSSPHSFEFEDGTVLEGCGPDRATTLMLASVEVEKPNKGWVDIELRFEMTEPVCEAIKALNKDDDIDIILVPLPVMTALKSANMEIGKARVIRVVDRVKKTISCNKFCC
jgi:hypothetical protein